MRRRWGGQSCIKFTSRLVEYLDVAFETELNEAESSQVCFRHWKDPKCRAVLNAYLSKTVFKTAWGLVAMPFDYLVQSAMLMAEPMIEESAWPLLVQPLEQWVTELQNFMAEGEEKIDVVEDFEKMFADRTQALKKGRLGAVKFLNEQIGPICKGLGLTLDPGENVNIEQLIKATEDKARKDWGAAPATPAVPSKPAGKPSPGAPAATPAAGKPR